MRHKNNYNYKWLVVVCCYFLIIKYGIVTTGMLLMLKRNKAPAFGAITEIHIITSRH